MFSFPFKDDPFFSGFPDHTGRLGIGFGENNGNMLRPFESMDGSVNQMRSMMDDMSHGMQNQVSLDGGNGHSYVQSSVYSYSRNADGQPEIYEAHQSNRHAPGGVREERKALRDSRKKLEKMAVGRHLGERGHVVERSRNTDTGHMSQHQNLIGIEEADVDAYQTEWHERTNAWSPPNSRHRRIGEERSERHRGVGGRDEHSRRQPALEYHSQRDMPPHRRH